MFLSFLYIYIRADTHTVQSISCSFALVHLCFCGKKKRKKKIMLFFQLGIVQNIVIHPKEKSSSYFYPSWK